MHEIAELLLKHGADVENPSSDKETILMKTIYNGNESMIPLLLKYKADPFVQVNGSNPLTYAMIKRHTSIVEMLREVHRARFLHPNDLILTMFSIVKLDFSIWETFLLSPTRQALHEMIVADQIDRIACFTALLQNEDKQLQLYRENKPCEFSTSTLRQIIRPMRHIYQLIVSYTIYPSSVRMLFQRYRTSMHL
jgi:ankyrin repeat protein